MVKCLSVNLFTRTAVLYVLHELNEFLFSAPTCNVSELAAYRRNININDLQLLSSFSVYLCLFFKSNPSVRSSHQPSLK